MRTRREFLRSIAALAGAGVATPAFLRALDSGMPPSLFHAPPAVWRVTGTTAQVNVVLPATGELTVDWGLSPKALNRRVGVSGFGSLTATLEDLAPGTTYWYRASVRQSASRAMSPMGVRSFVTQRRADEGFRFLVCTDSHLLGGPGVYPHYQTIRATAQMAAQEGADFVIFAGDEACLDGSGALQDRTGITRDQQEVNERYALWRRAWEQLLAVCPGYFALGNHETEGGCFAEVVRHGRVYNWQRWGAVARKQYVLNPRPDTYPEGGENEGWRDSGDATGLHASPLENYFAWSWGDALFIVLDPFRYCGPIEPERPEDWTLGGAQLAWLQRTLEQTTKKHVFIFAHHLVGGSPWNPEMNAPGGYGRGGAEYAHIGEQAIIHELMIRHGARFFIYGHDHILRLKERDGIAYVSAGRSNRSSRTWWSNPGWREAYGDDFIGLTGYLIVDIDDDGVRMSYRISADSPWNSTRFDGIEYPLRSGNRVTVDEEVRDIIRVWEPGDARKRDLFIGGSIEGRDLILGRAPRKGSQTVRAAFVGQKFRVGTFPNR